MSLKHFILVLLAFPTALLPQESAWKRIGPSGGKVMTLESSSSGQTVYLGTTDGHVFASNDGARHWDLRGRVGFRTDAVITRLLANPSKPDVVYAAAWYQQPGAGGGVFRSEDAGRTWRLLGLGQEAVRALEVARTQPLTLLAGTRTGVFRSEDAGQTWLQISPPGDEELRNVDSLAVDPTDTNVLYAGTYHLPWKSIDAGKNWSPVVAGLIDDSDVMSIRLDVTNPARLFLSACSGIYRSENKGAQWTKLQGIPYASRRTHSILQDPQSPQTLYAATTEGLWITRDAGETWNRRTSKDWVVNNVLILPSPSAGTPRIVLGTEAQGIMVSDDGGENFLPSNEGFSHGVVKQFLGDFRDPKRLLYVMQQHGTQIMQSLDSGHSWTALSTQAVNQGGKGIQLPMDCIDELYSSPWGWLARLQNGQLWLLDEQAGTWREWKLRLGTNSAPPVHMPMNKVGRTSSVALTKSILTIGPLAFSNSYAFIPSQTGLLRCDREGNCFSLKVFVHPGRLEALQVSADGSLLTVMEESRLAISSDAGESASWRDSPISTSRALWIDNVQESGISTLYLGTTEGLFISSNGGVSWIKQQNGLPAGQVEKWLRRPQFMVATLREGGMYVSYDNGKAWRRADRDTERSRFVGLVETEPGSLVIGSQTEGLLVWQNR